ncbi:helix-turn-helix domain-containing protein [Actinopolymorpha sp. B9G3]|uniref:helix-turn-helix domain-containing protein n=1 Tax=Actinopolymorpha sp. B9G3 TaxID=3158970 RepID=UPI0032D949DB
MSQSSRTHHPAHADTGGVDRTQLRLQVRDLALQSALRKRASGVPTYSVPEAAALLSISQEHLYRLIRADAFPAVRMRTGGDQGRYVIPAKAVEQILDAASTGGGRVDVMELADAWQTTRPAAVRGGVA